jgi:hypothetical protein
MWYSAIGCLVMLTLGLLVVPLVAEAQPVRKVPGLAISGHCQVNAKNCTSVQQREDYTGFGAFTIPCIFALPIPSAFLKGKASGSNFSLT